MPKHTRYAAARLKLPKRTGRPTDLHAVYPLALLTGNGERKNARSIV